MTMYAFSGNFDNPTAATNWAYKQLPLLQKWGVRLYLVKGKHGYVIWRSESTRDAKANMLIGGNRVTFTEYAKQTVNDRDPMISTYNHLNIIREINASGMRSARKRR